MGGVTRVLVAVALLAAACSGGQSPSGGTLQRIHDRGEIVWGADIQGGEPYVYEDPNDSDHLIGFEVDIMEALARRLGVKQKFVQFNWSNLVPSLERGDFDIAMNGLEATTDRAAIILMSRPYFVYAETLAVRADSKARSLDDLKGKKIGTLNQTYAYELLRARPVETVLYEGVEEPYLDLVHGRIDAVLIDNIIADRYGCSMDGVRCLPDEVARGAYIIGIRKQDPELKEAIDAQLEAMVADGELRRILDKWRLWDDRQTGPLPMTSATPQVADRSFDGGQ
ncbi:MAG TPA: ABC transporter substrate-binding protein, partial [Kofleriaceae bacterium]|nr:ABC transporter substrate-binding protein [Kofleriaceae bacterium]